MAHTAYFSNHSSSRFLPTSPNPQHPAPSPNPSAPPSSPARSRLPSSKHFSTSLTNQPSPERSRSKDAVSPNSSAPASISHPLRNTWVFWFRQQRTPGNKIISYEEGIKKISAFSSVESFWSLWTHLSPPSALLPTTDYLLFHSGIRRPVWEDPLNLPGGKWIIRLRKGVTDRIWEDLVLAIIGDQFDDCRSTLPSSEKQNGAASANGDNAANSEDGGEPTAWPEICGCTISVRQSEDIISLWNRVDGDTKLREKIRDTLKKVLNLPPSTIMEYKSNNDSMQDKSSFRNSAIDRSSLVTPHS
ncbi:translation initiation factor eIF 4e-like domain-containing protein [Cyathus striatus]|nr:translation initiation factor eIF 4e-like domain-containing protein [Cyathus striatus]